MNVTAERIKAFRSEHPDICWRPNGTWANVCLLDLGHVGRCGWERDLFGGSETARDAIIAIHEPYEDVVEQYHEDDDDLGDLPGECPDRVPDGCPGHDVPILVCRECGHDHDGDHVQLRPWPCPTLQALGVTA